MAKEYGENNAEAGGEASLSEKVKGKQDVSGSSFKPFENPKGGEKGEGGDDDQKFSGFGKVKNDVAMPQDKEKSLPKAGKTV